MTNWEKYKDELIEAKRDKDLHCFVEKHKEEIGINFIGRSSVEHLYFSVWLTEEYQDPEDWSKVEVDTPILVSNDGVKWFKRYFAKCENGHVGTWLNGCSSWTVDNDDNVTVWLYAKLAEVGSDGNKKEI